MTRAINKKNHSSQSISITNRDNSIFGRRVYSVIILTVLILIIPCFSFADNKTKPPAGERAVNHGETAPANETLPLYHFGIPPYQKGQTVDEIRGLYQPMLKWLGKQVGCRFDFIGGETYEDMIEMVAEGKVQLAGLGPVPYVVAKQKNPQIKLLLTELKWNPERTKLVDAYHGYILVLKTRNDLNNLKDLKGKPFAFVSHHSTSGYQYPNALLREKGIIPDEYFSKVYFLGSHPRVTDAIAAGSVAAGATWDYNWNRAKKKHGDIFKILLETPPIPNLTIVSHPSLPAEIAAKIKKVLPSIDQALLKGLPSAGFAVRSDDFYDGIRLIVEKEKRREENK
ncbi:phosphate-import protein PhnD precursor [bacterium BMS3Abin10]|nr:phosphate-import protein PhnD precursor [bacterium BMS3Abin10]